MKLSRRTFLQAPATAASIYRPAQSHAQQSPESEAVATLIDMTRGDGCEKLSGPQCANACQKKNQTNFPEPDPAMLKDYWPKKGCEDLNDKRDID